MRILRVANLAGPLALAVLLVAGCGGSGSAGKVENRPAPAASSFPSSNGKSLFEVLKGASGSTTLVLLPTQQVYHKGKNRFGFGVFTRSAKKQVSNAQVAVYVAKAPPPGKVPTPKANGASAGKGPESKLAAELGNPASGPYPAKVESLATEPAFTAKTTADDPNAGKIVYTTEINLPSNGEWRIGALIKDGNKLSASVLPSATVGKFNDIPRVGQRPPTSTRRLRRRSGDLSKLTTRIPPETMNKVDFADVLGKKPIVLLFATPQFCQSRVCGPVVDEAAQVQRDFGDKAEFIHMEIYNNNDPSKGVRPQVRAFHLPSEPWLFVIDRKGVIRTAIEGAFNVQELTDAVKGSDRRLSEEIDIKLIESFAEEARRRCDVIVAGLETGTNDYEALRAESHALKGTAAVVQLQRLAELAGLMESDLAEAAKTGQLRDNRIQQISDAAKALAEGAEAAAAGNEEPADVGRSLAQLFSA